MTEVLAPLTAADAQALATLHAEGFAQGWAAKDFHEILAMPGTFGLGLKPQNGEGFVAFVLARQTSDEMEIITLVVAKSARRRGLAGALMRGIQQGGREKGARQLFLEVADDNAAAIALYEGLGFQEVGRRPNYYGRQSPSGPVDARVLRLALSGCTSKPQ